MTPTPEERSYLLTCALVWDRAAEAWYPVRGSIKTAYGLCETIIWITTPDERHREVGRVPSLNMQLVQSCPWGQAIWYWWPHGKCHAERAGHARKLAVRCRALAAG